MSDASTGQSMIRWEQRPNGVVVLTIDDPTQSVNTMNALYTSAMNTVVGRLYAEKDSVTGVILTSAKKSFFAGGDIDLMIAATDAAALFAEIEQMKGPLRRLELLGRPVVAAINGAALGGGLEIALACHHRVALDARSSRIGLPEVTLGLIPGGGGINRTVRMLGLQKALTQVLLSGQQYSPAQALALGLVDDVVATPEEMMAAAEAWILANPDAAQPWDRKGFKIPGGTPASPALAASLPSFPATLRKQLKGANYPAPKAILAAAVEGTQVDIDSALRVESSYLTSIILDPAAKNMMQVFFLDKRAIDAGASRPAGFPRHAASKVLVLGAGMMGAGIAYMCAQAGLQVVLRDLSVSAAEKGKAYSAGLVAKAVAKGRLSQEKADALLDRILATDSIDDAAGADLVIEAVFEDPALKQKLFAEIESVVAPDAVLGSNTSTLPITMLAEGVQRQDSFIGLHFFSPVDKMPLLEIVVGGKTSDATLAKAFDIALQIRKTPIVVNDSRGFFTSRVIGKFLDEAIAMVGEGVDPASVEQAGLQAGYPAAPLALYDELTLTLPRKIREETKAAALAEGAMWQEHGSESVVDRMIDEFDRKGRSTGGGFYDYADGRRVGLWPGLREHFTRAGHTIPFEDMKERMLFAETIDTIRCFDEGVLRSVADANIGSILGIGYPSWTGGVLQYVNTYPGGASGFLARARELARLYGPRFEAPQSLIRLAAADGQYRD
ncbi:3-hydroxyacyl-CoA dehydrogenase NAD-binding [Parafrankia sp. EAN1pec]|uniref:3-hydroxyacyl-CoA dehydrogenase NAD-binding domain-containing protein n=1 Tax=Parafrankia sp. (strain EAN1pec) TaxID=298653 RepID=UPI000054267C|nr:3-hydroxyacyl-CoA dehydrogenase NAD-binding [Frankia sp. EAN1pec]